MRPTLSFLIFAHLERFGARLLGWEGPFFLLPLVWLVAIAFVIVFAVYLVTFRITAEIGRSWQWAPRW